MVDMLTVNVCLCPLHLLTSFVSTWCLFASFRYTCALHLLCPLVSFAHAFAFHTCLHPLCPLVPFTSTCTLHACSCPLHQLTHAHALQAHLNNLCIHLCLLMPTHILHWDSYPCLIISSLYMIVNIFQFLTNLLTTFTAGIIPD